MLILLKMIESIDMTLCVISFLVYIYYKDTYALINYIAHVLKSYWILPISQFGFECRAGFGSSFLNRLKDSSHTLREHLRTHEIFIVDQILVIRYFLHTCNYNVLLKIICCCFLLESPPRGHSKRSSQHKILLTEK